MKKNEKLIYSVSPILRNIIYNDAILVTASFTGEEMLNIFRKNLIDDIRQLKKQQYSGVSNKVVLQNESHILRDATTARDQIMARFTSIPGFIATYNVNSELLTLETELIQNTGLDAGDARHLILGKSIKDPALTGFLSLDSDYARINDPDFPIYIPDRFLSSGSSGTVNCVIPTIEVSIE